MQWLRRRTVYRLRYRLFAITVRCGLVISSLLLLVNIYRWSTRCFDDYSGLVRSTDTKLLLRNFTSHDVTSHNCRPITCNLNGGDVMVDCCLHKNEVYLPFQAIERYFEVYGSLATNNETNEREHFAVNFALSKVHQTSEKYSTTGAYMSFEYYNVERRTHLKCISGIEEVPVSSQWNSGGYYYPTQIAQYGLSHYSKHEAQLRRETDAPSQTSSFRYYATADARQPLTGTRWRKSATSVLSQVYDVSLRRNVYQFKTRGFYAVCLCTVKTSGGSISYCKVQYDIDVCD